MVEEILWLLEKVQQQLVGDLALEWLVRNDGVGEKLLVEHASVRTPF